MKTSLLAWLLAAGCLPLFAALLSPPGSPGPAPSSAAQPAPSLAGWIVRLVGSAELDHADKTTPLEESTAGLFRPLFDGDRIRCHPATAPRRTNSFVEIALLWGGTVRITNTTTAVAITALPAPTGAPHWITNALRENLRAGRARGDSEGLIREPAEGARLRVRDFRGILWEAGRAPTRVAVVLADSGDRVLWRRRDLDGTSAACLAPALREALAEAARKPTTEFAAELRDDRGRTLDRTRFSLLPAEDETELEDGLAWWDARSEGIPRRLGRALVFSSHGLHAAAADELDLALADPGSAGSHSLLAAAIAANERAGRPGRVRELRRELEALPPEPDTLPAAR